MRKKQPKSERQTQLNAWIMHYKLHFAIDRKFHQITEKYYCTIKQFAMDVDNCILWQHPMYKAILVSDLRVTWKGNSFSIIFCYYVKNYSWQTTVKRTIKCNNKPSTNRVLSNALDIMHNTWNYTYGPFGCMNCVLINQSDLRSTRPVRFWSLHDCIHCQCRVDLISTWKRICNSL